MLQYLRIILIYTLAISVVVLGIRPLITTYLNFPIVASWSINAEEEEEQKKDTNEEESEKKIVDHPLAFNFFHFYKKSTLEDILNINIIHLPYPTPPPQS